MNYFACLNGCLNVFQRRVKRASKQDLVERDTFQTLQIRILCIVSQNIKVIQCKSSYAESLCKPLWILGDSIS